MLLRTFCLWNILQWKLYKNTAIFKDTDAFQNFIVQISANFDNRNKALVGPFENIFAGEAILYMWIVGLDVGHCLTNIVHICVTCVTLANVHTAVESILTSHTWISHEYCYNKDTTIKQYFYKIRTEIINLSCISWNPCLVVFGIWKTT